MFLVLIVAAGLLQTPAPAGGATASPSQQERIDRAIELVRQEKLAEAFEEFRAILEAEPGNKREIGRAHV